MRPRGKSRIIAIKEMAQRPTKIHVPFCTVPGTVYLGSI